MSGGSLEEPRLLPKAARVEERDGDGIDWQWRGQPDGSEFYDSLVRAILRHVPRGSLVLEIGVGSGYALSELAVKAECAAVGVDLLSSAMDASRATARARGVRMLLLRGSGFALPLPDCAFDVVMSHGVIEHFSPERARLMLAEHARVCRRGGRVITSTPNTLDLLHGLRRFVLGRRYSYFPERSYSRWALARELTRVGLVPESADGYAPLWSLRQVRIAYPLTAVMHKTGLLRAVSQVSRPSLLSLIGNLTLLVARKP